MLEPAGFVVDSPADLGMDFGVDETGTTFEANARLKAESLSRLTGRVTIADDSGIVIDALGGEPGVRSARYGGAGATDDDRNRMVLDKLERVEDDARSARFVAAIAIAAPGCSTRVVQGEVEGVIAHERRGSSGFGYDPIFFHPPSGRTFGELLSSEKDAASHRGQALRAAAMVLQSLAKDGILS
jgi:XTP/dITP diphosphohydrolase